MASTRTICTECKSVITLPEPAEVGDVVACPKCEAYFAVPKTKTVPMPGAAKPATAAKPVAAMPAKPKPKVEVEEEDDLPPIPKKKPVVVVEDDDEDEDDEEEEEKPKKKKKKSGGGSGGKKKKKKRKSDESDYKNSPVRFIILGVLVLVMLVGGYFLYKKMMKGDPPEIVVRTTILDDESVMHEDGSIVKKDGTRIPPPGQKGDSPKPAPKGNNQGPKTGLRSVDRQKATNELRQLGTAYRNYLDTNGKPPAKPGDLLDYVEKKTAMVKDVEDGVYVLVMNAKLDNLPGGSSNTVLGYYHEVPQKGGMVLFADGSARYMNVAEFEAAPKAGK